MRFNLRPGLVRAKSGDTCRGICCFVEVGVLELVIGSESTHGYSRSQFGVLPAVQAAQVQDPWQCVSSEADLFEFGSFSSPAVSGQLSVDS